MAVQKKLKDSIYGARLWSSQILNKLCIKICEKKINMLKNI